ncbi:MAG TPA: ABC transporter ATP-binding protein [Anaerolineales bacterium]
MRDTLLGVRDLVVKRSEQTVLRVDALDIHDGEVLAVIGPNGAGKSTLLLVLARLLHPNAGQVLFRGSPIEEEDELTYRRRIALVLQEPLLMHQSVFDNVASGLRFRGLPRTEVRQRVEEWLNRLDIYQLRNRPAQRLSGGEAQRTSLARAFVLQPELLLLDEPFSALDAPTRTRLLQDLHSLLSQINITTVFITHDLDEALLLGDKVAVLLGGVLRQVGRPQEVFTAPSDGEVAAFVGVETVIAGKVSASQNGLVTVEADGLHLEAVGDEPIGTPVLFCLRPEDITLSISDRVIQSSARNHLSGRIQRITPSGPLVRVVVDCGLPVVALITRGSANEMKLAEGQTISATFKATAVHLIPR